MKLPAITLALLGASASATAEQQLRAGQAASIDANSVHAHRLLSSANTRALENNAEEDTTWMVNYALQFDSCHEIAAVGGEAGGGGAEEGTGSGVQRLVKLKLCPKDTCGGSCRNGAEYLVEMREFLETYMQQKEEMEEQQCEYQQQKCEYSCENQYNNNNNNNNNNQNNANRMLEDNANNNYYNEDYCLMNCLSEAGYGDCYEGDDNGNNNNNNGNQAEDLDYARFAECESLYEGNNNNNGNYNGNAQAAYVGAYCSKGGSAINLGVFSDPSCTVKSDNSLFESVYYQSLPYATTSMVGRECLSCDAAEYEWEADDDGNNNNGNNGYNYEVAEICEEVHERAAKCEKNLQIDTSASAYNNGGYTRYYPHTESCQLIHSTLSSLESVTKTNGKSLKTARAFAWIFFFTTLGAVGYILYLHKNKEGKIDLSLQGVLGGGDAVESSRIA